MTPEHPRRLRVALAIRTFIAVVLFFGPLLRDSNASHLTHPDWPGHARLHFMWAIAFMFCSGLANLYYLWLRPLEIGALRLCCAWQAASLLGGFWTAVALAGLYGGTIRDPEHHMTVLGINENVLVFGVLAVLLVGVVLHVRPRVEPSAGA